MLVDQLLHRGEEPLAGLRPRCLVRVRVGVLLEPCLALGVIEDRVDRLRDALRRPEVDQDAPVLRERLLRVQVRRRDHRLARAQRVGQRAARDLVRVEVGRHVDVGGEQVLDDVLLVEVLVDEEHLVAETELVDELLQTVAVLLASLLEQFGVGLAGDQVERLGVAGHDRGHGLDRVLEALAGPDEAEGRDDRVPVEPELRLQPASSLRLDVRHAVRDHERVLGDPVVALEDLDGALGHHREAVRRLGDRSDRVADRGRGIGQHRVHVHERGLLQLLEERGQVVLVRALDPLVADEAAALPEAVEAELVLHADDVGVGSVDRVGGGAIGHRAALADPPTDLAAVGADRAALVDRGDTGLCLGVGLADGRHHVGREGGDAAAPGGIGGNERDPHEGLAYPGPSSGHRA